MIRSKSSLFLYLHLTIHHYRWIIRLVLIICCSDCGLRLLCILCSPGCWHLSEGFKEAAEKFSMESGISSGVDLTSLDDRIKYVGCWRQCILVSAWTLTFCRKTSCSCVNPAFNTHLISNVARRHSLRQSLYPPYFMIVTTYDQQPVSMTTGFGTLSGMAASQTPQTWWTSCTRSCWTATATSTSTCSSSIWSSWSETAAWKRRSGETRTGSQVGSGGLSGETGEGLLSAIEKVVKQDQHRFSSWIETEKVLVFDQRRFSGMMKKVLRGNGRVGSGEIGESAQKRPENVPSLHEQDLEDLSFSHWNRENHVVVSYKPENWRGAQCFDAHLW